MNFNTVQDQNGWKEEREGKKRVIHFVHCELDEKKMDMNSRHEKKQQYFNNSNTTRKKN
jgi:hypothetical protein